MRFPEKKEEKKSQISFNEDGSLFIPENIAKELQKKNLNNIFDDLGKDYDEITEFDEKKYNVGDDVSGFNIYQNGKRLEPLRFSNNKTQEDIVNEVINAIENGKKIIFIRGACGTGKSVIALNIAKNFEKASVVVPGKALQKQYKNDYSKEKYILKKDNKKLKIKVITGRANHRCLFKDGVSADDAELPCKIEIKERNMNRLRMYLKENNRVKDDLELKNIRRVSIAPICPYWSPIVRGEYDLPIGGEKRKYKGLKGINFNIYNRKKGCTYYNQFNSYIDSEAIVFNSAKYLLECIMNRKPETDVEIIDECDEFLDSFSNVSRLNLNRLANSLSNLFSEDRVLNDVIRKIADLTEEIIHEGNMRILNRDITKLKNTRIYELLKYFLDYSQIVEIIDEDSYCHNAYETAVEFKEFFDDAYVNFSFEERGVIANITITSLDRKFSELTEKNKVFVLMSGTIHSEKVLKSIYGIKEFYFIDAETHNPGKILIKETGREMDCKYENFNNGNALRDDYLIALDSCVNLSVKPTLVHVQSFDDLPSEDEKVNYNLKNLITKESLIKMQDEDSELIDKFKKGLIDVLFTTKCSRGVDFPGEQCNSIIFTKYPYPNVQSIFWKVLKKTHPMHYWDFYKDKAHREFLQKIYRGVRSKNDSIYILSPDKRVLDAVRKVGNYNNLPP